MEAVVLIAGLVFVVASYFLPAKGEKESVQIGDGEMEQALRKLKEAAVFHEDELKQKVQEIVEKNSSTLIAEAEEDMKRLSNEKIMAIDEFSNQVLEKIENNNQEVIFLYDMFQRKEEEMKVTMDKMEQTRKENRELFERLEELKKAKAKANGRAAQKQAAQEAEQRMEQRKEQIHRKLHHEEQVQEAQSEPVYSTQAAGLSEAVEKQAEEPVYEAEPSVKAAQEEKERKEQVLELYQKNYTIREISRELSMGQSEVKLIIDLYAKTAR